MKKKFLLLNLILLQMVQGMEEEPQRKHYYSFVMNTSTEIKLDLESNNKKPLNFCNLLKRIGLIENDTKCSSGISLLVQLWFNAGKND